MSSVTALTFVTMSRNRTNVQAQGCTKATATLRGIVKFIVYGAVLVALVALAQAQPFQVLHNFNGNGIDGAYPNAGLIQDASGNLYGTTGGGAYSAGAVFKINLQGAESVLYSFAGNKDGLLPYAALILDGKGNLYGTTYAGGALPVLAALSFA